MSRKNHTPIVTALTLAAAGIAIAATAWLTSAQESTPVTTATTAHATTNANANSDANASQPVAASPSPQAQQAPVAATAAATPAAAAAAQATTQQPSAPSTAGQRAFIDPATGQFRQPEHEELAAIAAEAAAGGLARRAAARTATAAAASFDDDGSVSTTVPEELHTFTVATRGPDGRIVIEHAQGAASAARMVKANSAKNTPRASVSRAQKEDRDDR